MTCPVIRLKEFYERLVSHGKLKKVAIIAVMRKLLVLPYGVLKSEKNTMKIIKPLNVFRKKSIGWFSYYV